MHLYSPRGLIKWSFYQTFEYIKLFITKATMRCLPTFSAKRQLMNVRVCPSLEIWVAQQSMTSGFLVVVKNSWSTVVKSVIANFRHPITRHTRRHQLRCQSRQRKRYSLLNLVAKSYLAEVIPTCSLFYLNLIRLVRTAVRYHVTFPVTSDGPSECLQQSAAYCRP